MDDHEGFRHALLSWYGKSRRDLPWRRTRDPYAILVSEILLQQTRVQTGEGYFRRFMARFPSVQVLARASMDEVLRVWEGLGYYRRARLLHAAAKQIVERHNGQVPSDLEALTALPGVGPYTAGAVASIAFGESVPAVDGNVTRVLARLRRIQENVALSGTRARIHMEASDLVPRRDPGSFNQALMELGALVCLPKVPDCGACPVLPWCAARAAGEETRLPRRTPRSAVPSVTAVFALLERPGEILMVRRDRDELLGNLWALPGGEIDSGEVPTDGLRRLLRENHKLDVEPGPEIGRHRHTFSHKRWDAIGIRCSEIETIRLSPGLKWVPRDGLDQLPLVPFHRAFLVGDESAPLENFP